MIPYFRTASKREILKAYRKLAQKWHPDNFQGDEKAKAQNKFIDIAAAKEVLTDPGIYSFLSNNSGVFNHLCISHTSNKNDKIKKKIQFVYIAPSLIILLQEGVICVVM